jgi:hypothetical protein
VRLPRKKLDIEKILEMPSPEIPVSAFLAALKAERE